MSKSASFWNNKWQQAPITYSGRALRGSAERIVCDVKCFITPNDAILNEVVQDYRLKKSTPNATAQAIQQFVEIFLEYTGDDESSECPEFWQFPFETMQSGIGDCEDGAILIASLMINAGIPPHRIKVCAGYVQEGPTAPQGGHAYCIYLADRGWRRQDWVVMDWCYYQDPEISPERKPLAKEGGQKGFYGDLWFTFNNEYSWNQESLEIEARRISRNRSSTSLKEQSSSEMALKTLMTKIHSKVEA